MESNRNAQLIMPSKFCFPELNDIIESLGLWMLKMENRMKSEIFEYLHILITMDKLLNSSSYLFK